jgi:hypothetical protein
MNLNNEAEYDWIVALNAASAFGPKRHLAAPSNNVAIGVTTDIDRQR